MMAMLALYLLMTSFGSVEGPLTTPSPLLLEGGILNFQYREREGLEEGLFFFLEEKKQGSQLVFFGRWFQGKKRSQVKHKEKKKRRRWKWKWKSKKRKQQSWKREKDSTNSLHLKPYANQTGSLAFPSYRPPSSKSQPMTSSSNLPPLLLHPPWRKF